MALDGYRPLGGSTRRYVDPTGAEISRRTYQQREREARLGELVTNEEYRARRQAAGEFSHMKEHTKRLGEYLKAHPEAKARDVERKRTVKQLRDDLRSPDISATGPKARALVELGYREAWWPWAVGETPTALHSFAVAA